MESTNNDLQALSARLDKLETQNQRWKLAAILLALSSTSLVLSAAKPADQTDPSVIHARTIEAQDFVLKDEDGQIRAQLAVNPTNKKEVNGKHVLIMNPASGPALQFFNANGDAIWTAPQSPAMIPAK